MVRPNKVLATEVAAIRRRRGLSQAELAAALVRLGYDKLDRSALSKLETGTRATSVDDLFALAAALETSPMRLLQAPGDEPVEVVPSIQLDPDMLRPWMTGWEPLPGTDIDSKRRYLEDLRRDEVTGQFNPMVRTLGRLFNRLLAVADDPEMREEADETYNWLAAETMSVTRQASAKLDAIAEQ